MQKVLTAAQMREVDRLTTERYGIPSIILMENAAHAVARVITQKLGGSVEGKSILILCGPGNNGGDGAVLARLLAVQEATVYVAVFGDIANASEDAKRNFEAIKLISSTEDIVFENIRASEEWKQFRERHWLHWEPHLVVDALFGTGLKRPLSGLFGEAASYIRGFCVEGVEQNVEVVSVDLPSGLDADHSDFLGGSVVRAHTTVTFTAPKIANIIPPANERNGELFIGKIGTPQELIDQQPSHLFLAEKKDVAEWLRKSAFSNSSYKNKRGHALMIAGSRDYSGAAVLCGDAAIRSGCGLVTIATPESSRESIVARVSPEVMVRGIAETENGSAAEKAFDEIAEFSKNVNVIAVGSGLSSKEEETKRFIKRVVDERKTPIVIDADGLTAFSPWHKRVSSPTVKEGAADDEKNSTASNWPPADAGGSDLILTPHEGEFRKLLGLEKEEFEETIKDRVQAVRDFATMHNVFLVLKGERVLIGAPNGNVVVNPTGNSGLGKAGNGDTLAGIITGFVAQAVQMKIDVFETIVAAVYVAGMAGDIAEKKFGKRVMTASDVRECLVDVFQQFSSVDSDE